MVWLTQQAWNTYFTVVHQNENTCNDVHMYTSPPHSHLYALYLQIFAIFTWLKHMREFRKTYARFT